MRAYTRKFRWSDFFNPKYLFERWWYQQYVRYCPPEKNNPTWYGCPIGPDGIEVVARVEKFSEKHPPVKLPFMDDRMELTKKSDSFYCGPKS
jgi:hypothetical protein